MKPRTIIATALLALTLPLLAACGTTTTAQTQPTVVPTATRVPTVTPLPSPTREPEPEPLSGTGQVTSSRDANLSFMVAGQVAELKVEEGATIKQGDVIAVLDIRPFDVQIKQAQAAVAQAVAQRNTLSDPPRAADVRAARAQVQQAQIAVEQARNAQTQDIRTADAAIASGEAGLQSARDQLSAAKTNAELTLQQATNALTQAQSNYATAKGNWEYVQETGADPTMPRLVDPSSGKRSKNKLNDVQRQQYYDAFVQADAALRSAEASVQQAQVAFDNARQAEITGIAQSEQALAQARAARDRLNLPVSADQIAAANAAVAGAQAEVARLNPAPSKSQRAQATAGIAQAEAALEQARLNREYATIRAPFDGVITKLDTDVGEMVSPGTSVVQMVDGNALRFELPVADIDITRVQVGQRVTVRLDALSAKPFSGTVSYIAPSAAGEGTVRTYIVRVALDSTTGVRVGMRGQVVVAPPTQK